MKIAIMGAGGLGGYLGAQLARAGRDVTFIARGRASDVHPGERAASAQPGRRFPGQPGAGNC